MALYHSIEVHTAPRIKTKAAERPATFLATTAIAPTIGQLLATQTNTTIATRSGTGQAARKAAGSTMRVTMSRAKVFGQIQQAGKSTDDKDLARRILLLRHRRRPRVAIRGTREVMAGPKRGRKEEISKEAFCRDCLGV